MRKFIWIGSYLNDEILKYYQECGYKNASSYVSQKNIIEGLKKVGKLNFDSLNMISFKGAPYDKTLFVKGKTFKDGNNENIVVGYLNIIYLNKLFGSISLEKATKKWINDNSENLNLKVDIFIYEMRSACLNAAILIKRSFPNSKIHLIVPDLPMFMDLKMSFIKQVLKKIDWMKIKGQLSYVDDYILYAEPMADFLKIKNKPWLLMEGSINNRELNKNKIIISKNDAKFIVMYSGTIDKKFGLFELVNAFNYLDDKFELWITGGGKDADELKQLCFNNTKVKYFGFLPSREDLLALQRKASAFVNIRDPKIPASKYCFPSKLFEYMLIGKPVITCELEGIPKEYYNYLIKFKNLDSKEIANVIKTVAVMPENTKHKLGEITRKFIMENKNNCKQAERILDFIDYESD